MTNGRKNNLKTGTTGFLLLVVLVLTSSFLIIDMPVYGIGNSLTGYDAAVLPSILLDTVPQKPDSVLIKKDSVVAVNDTFSVKYSKDSLDAPVDYEAADSMVFDVPNKQIILYSKGRIKYKDMDLQADSISMDQNTTMLEATYRKDSTGKVIGLPNMVQGETKMQADVIQFNYKTQRGLTKNTYTTQGEMHVNMERSKKFSENEYFALRGRITTCNLDTPHFAFRTNKMKLINQKLAVTGPIHPEFEDVPVPLYIPFGIFPLSSGRHSGFIAPQFTASEQFGLGLEGLGYYKVLNDYFDVTFRANTYSYGGWNVFLTPTYRKRYRYNGSLNLAYQSTRILSRDAKQEFQQSRTFNITWSHSVDQRARPGTTFSASVNAGSTKFNQFISNNPTRNFSNQLNSSINYSKTWGSRYNFSMSATHNQNNNTGLINMSLPNATFTVNTFYPFQKKEFTGAPKWYEKLGIGLNTNMANQISFYDSLFSLRRILDTIQWGAQHSVPIQMALPPLGSLQISPGITFNEKWYSRQFIRRWNSTTRKVDTSLNKGFYTSRDVSFSLGLNTAIFGTYDKFKKTGKLVAIRHVIRPTLSVNYKPDLARKDYYSTQIDTSGRQFRFSYFESSIFGPFSEGKFGGIGFGIDNNIEAKVRNKKDTTEGGIKRIKIIDGFGFNGSYNLIADSFKLSPISFYARSTLFEKINITAGASMDPYQFDTLGFRKKEYTWQGANKSLPRITSGNVAISATFQSKSKDKDKEKKVVTQNPNLPQQTMDEQMMQMEYVRQNPAEFVDFDVPWSLSVSYSLNFNRRFKRDYSGFETEIFSNMNVNGDFSLTPKWKVGMSGYYDFKTSKIQSVTTFITREMHCWQLSINVTPVGLYRSFNITVNPKSGLLRDLKVNRTRYFYGN